MNIIAALDVGFDAVGKENAGQLMADAKLLYGVYDAISSAGKFDPAIMVKDGTLKPVVEALARTTKTLSAMLDDPNQAQPVATLFGSI